MKIETKLDRITLKRADYRKYTKKDSHVLKANTE